MGIQSDSDTHPAELKLMPMSDPVCNSVALASSPLHPRNVGARESMVPGP